MKKKQLTYVALVSGLLLHTAVPRENLFRK